MILLIAVLVIYCYITNCHKFGLKPVYLYYLSVFRWGVQTWRNGFFPSWSHRATTVKVHTNCIFILSLEFLSQFSSLHLVELSPFFFARDCSRILSDSRSCLQFLIINLLYHGLLQSQSKLYCSSLQSWSCHLLLFFCLLFGFSRQGFSV